MLIDLVIILLEKSCHLQLRTSRVFQRHEFGVKHYLATLLILLEILKRNSTEARECSLKGKTKILVFVSTFLVLPVYKEVLSMVFHSMPPRVTL